MEIYPIPMQNMLRGLRRSQRLWLFISLCALSLPSVIAGDFNVKLNLLDDPNTRSFLRLLDEYNFVALYPVSPTHRLGNVLDFLIVSADFRDAYQTLRLRVVTTILFCLALMVVLGYIVLMLRH